MLIGATLYVDVLKPPSLLSLSLQGEKRDIVQVIQHLLKSHKSLRTLAEQDPQQWPTVKLIKEENDNKVYQGSVLMGTPPECLNSALTKPLQTSNDWTRR